MKYKLSILIPTLSSRANQCMSLVDKMLDQVEKGNYIGLVEIVTLYDDGKKSIGTKRNELIQMAKGDYVCFIDDDDDIGSLKVSVMKYPFVVYFISSNSRICQFLAFCFLHSMQFPHPMGTFVTLGSVTGGTLPPFFLFGLYFGFVTSLGYRHMVFFL